MSPRLGVCMGRVCGLYALCTGNQAGEQTNPRTEECMKYRVYENNGGGLVLFVYGIDGEVIFAHSGYEYCPGQLRTDLMALDEGADPGTWEGNQPELTESEYTDESYRNGEWRIVAENGSRTPWGASSTKELEV